MERSDIYRVIITSVISAVVVLCLYFTFSKEMTVPAVSHKTENTKKNYSTSGKYTGEPFSDEIWKEVYNNTDSDINIFYLKEPSYLLDTDITDNTEGMNASGAFLDLRYFFMMNYNYLKDTLPGKTIKMRILVPFLPEGYNPAIPDRLRFVVKSCTGSEWAEYYGEKELTSIKKAGYYDIEIKIPEKSVTDKSGKIFTPEDTAAVAIDYMRPDEDAADREVFFLITGFSVEGLDIRFDRIKWQITHNGYIVKKKYLPFFDAGSSLFTLKGFSGKAVFNFSSGKISLPEGYENNEFNDIVELPVFVSDNLGVADNKFTLSLRSKNDIYPPVSRTRGLGSLDKYSYTDIVVNADDIRNGNSKVRYSPSGGAIELLPYLDVNITSLKGSGYMYFILGPLSVKPGYMMPFDSKWNVRDIQGLNGYKCVDINENGKMGSCGVTISRVGGNVYNMDTNVLLKGGVDWDNPFYRVELYRPFSSGPRDMRNMELEVTLSPITDTTNLWQKPYRSRIGLLDVNGKVMMGPNVSVSEGLPVKAYLKVIMSQPVAKGLVMQGFDPEKVSGVLINFEASPKTLDTKEIYVAFRDLIIRPEPLPENTNPKTLDFSVFKRTPEKWLLTGLIKSSGGFLVGINYPFATIDVPFDVLEVPQVYPMVGYKPGSGGHYGISSDITSSTIKKNFTLFADKGIDLVRVFFLGDTSGVFDWDLYNKKITGFSDTAEELLSKASALKVEDLPSFLKANEREIFGTSEKIPGINDYVMADFRKFFDILESIEKDTGKKVSVIMALFDFMFADNISSEGPLDKYSVGEHPEIIMDPETRIKTLALVWKLSSELKKDPRFARYIAAVEFINEPANATFFYSEEDFDRMVNFVSDGVYVLKTTLGETMPVSIGFRSWLPDLEYWQSLKDGIDMLAPHYWESLESYDINTPGLWPLDTPASDIWGYMGTVSSGRPTGIGEIGPGSDPKKYLFTIEKAGYDMALLWSYSGHDGFDIKPYMNEIAEYIQSDRIIKELQGTDADRRARAFDEIIKIKEKFVVKMDIGLAQKWTSENYNDLMEWVYDSIEASWTENIDIIRKILKVFELKSIPLSDENMDFIKRRASE